jgi:hypothetical protein
MQFIANQLMQFTDVRDYKEFSCLRKSIAQLNRRIGWVPKGWVPLYQDMVKSLMKLSDGEHGNAAVVGPWVEEATMEFTSRELTPVVAGILRKTTQRSKCTCTRCGLRGKMRKFGAETHEVLCARCYAPRELSDQLAMWIPRLESDEFLQTEAVIVVDDLDPAFLALIPQEQWRWLTDELDGVTLPYLLSSNLVNLLPELRDLYFLVQAMAIADE